MNDVLLSPVRLSELESLIEKSVQRAFASNQSGGSISSNNEELLTVPQIAEYLSLSTHYVYVLISRGDLPIMKRGKRVYASKADLFNYLKAGRKKTNSEIEADAIQHIANKKARK